MTLAPRRLSTGRYVRRRLERIDEPDARELVAD